MKFLPTTSLGHELVGVSGLGWGLFPSDVGTSLEKNPENCGVLLIRVSNYIIGFGKKTCFCHRKNIVTNHASPSPGMSILITKSWDVHPPSWLPFRVAWFHRHNSLEPKIHLQVFQSQSSWLNQSVAPWKDTNWEVEVCRTSLILRKMTVGTGRGQV